MDVVPLAEAGPLLDGLACEILFSDLDGTLVGRGGSLLADLDGRPTLAAAEALVAAHAAGLEVVLVSGRTRAQLHETGRLLGLRDAVAELGAVLVVEGKPVLEWGGAPKDLADTPAEALERSGALAFLLDSFAGRLEPHTPWHLARHGTALLRGQVDPAEADARLAEAGFGWARLLDNGRLHGHRHLGPGQTHAYHLLPVGVTKATGAAAYLARRGIQPGQAAAIGDAPADLELAATVGAMFVVANGVWAADQTRAAGGPAIATPSGAGQGWAEAVRALIGGR